MCARAVLRKDIKTRPPWQLPIFWGRGVESLGGEPWTGHLVDLAHTRDFAQSHNNCHPCQPVLKWPKLSCCRKCTDTYRNQKLFFRNILKCCEKGKPVLPQREVSRLFMRADQDGSRLGWDSGPTRPRSLFTFAFPPNWQY